MAFGLEELATAEGYVSVDQLLEDSILDSVCPSICVDCGYTCDMEPDQDAGYCESCGNNSVKSCLILAEVI